MLQTPGRPLVPNANYSTGAPTLSSPHACGGDPVETPFQKNKAKSKMEKLPCPRIVTHLPSAPSPGVSPPLVPQCLDPLTPFPNKHRRSAGGGKPKPVPVPERGPQQPARRTDTCVYIWNANMRNKPNLKIDNRPCPHTITHLPMREFVLRQSSLDALVPCCLSALLPQCLATSTP